MLALRSIGLYFKAKVKYKVGLQAEINVVFNNPKWFTIDQSFNSEYYSPSK